MYMNTLLHCHFCIQIITDHFVLSKVSHPIHTIPINAPLLYPILCPWKYSIRHKLLYCPVCIFACFHSNQRCVASYHYFYTCGVLQEVDIISTVRPYFQRHYLVLISQFVSYLHSHQKKASTMLSVTMHCPSIYDQFLSFHFQAWCVNLWIFFPFLMGMHVHPTMSISRECHKKVKTKSNITFICLHS